MSARKKAIREEFRCAVFDRDGHQCVFCECRTDLDAHHIVDRRELPAGGYVKENGITLCPFHHEQAEQFHATEGREWVPGMHPHDLYAKIGSSRALAATKSQCLITR